MLRIATLALIGCTLSLIGTNLNAEAAAWYRWQSVKTGKYICKQNDPGPGWVRHSGPYQDGGCRVLKQPPPLVSSDSVFTQTADYI